MEKIDYEQLVSKIKAWAIELGFSKVGIADIDLSQYETYFHEWLAKNFHGKMHYMEKHGAKRTRPAELVPGTLRVISVALDYLPPDTSFVEVLGNPKLGFISRYALGRDYHKVLKEKLKKLSDKINAAIPGSTYRAFVDTAPVLEKPLAEKAGLGWIGKHSNLLSEKGSSWFFLGEVFTNLPLPIDQPVTPRCGSCQACIDICPTKAIVAPKVVDARRCISYLTIELKDAIPLEFRSLLGNRIYGCDDCQLVCPWNKFVKASNEKDFKPRDDFTQPELLALFAWDEVTFLKKTEGSAMRRIGHEQWLRNIAVALGNAPKDEKIIIALKEKLNHPSALVREHVQWALDEQLNCME